MCSVYYICISIKYYIFIYEYNNNPTPFGST
jgi:hypothetical protein